MYFGTSKQALYGAYDPPRVRRQTAEAVVLCAPMGQEYMRAHKALRQLAGQLARNGIHALRFDYFGTGDSAGECERGTVEQWQQDIDAAIDELKDTSGVGRVSLVGLRLGGTLAATVAARRTDIDGLVLWDPIVDGEAYVRQLIDLGVQPDGSARRFTSPPGPTDTVSVRGFPLTPAMRTGLSQFALDAITVRARRIFLVVSKEQDDYQRLDRRLAGTPGYTTAMIPSASSWESAASAGGDLVAGAMVLPQQMIQGIVSWFAQEQHP